jgi:hypothetical protein
MNEAVKRLSEHVTEMNNVEADHGRGAVPERDHESLQKWSVTMSWWKPLPLSEGKGHAEPELKDN